MGRDRRIVTHCTKETIDFGFEFGKTLEPNTVLCLSGELGSGKTTLIKGIIQGITGIAPEKVLSPTFVYLNVYDKVYHFDLYRLCSYEEFLSLGFEEYLFSGGICCIEWSERIASIIPKNALFITLSHLEEESREIHISKSSFFDNGC